MKYTIQDIAKVVRGKLHLQDEVAIEIEHLLTDSRKIISPGTSLFFAIIGVRHDGHRFIDELVRSGVRISFSLTIQEKNMLRPAATLLWLMMRLSLCSSLLRITAFSLTFPLSVLQVATAKPLSKSGYIFCSATNTILSEAQRVITSRLVFRFRCGRLM